MGRFLCLHGMGCNGKIFKLQITPFMRKLGLQHEYVFLDGELECESAPGVEGILPAPYLTYYDTTSTVEIGLAHEQIHSTIEESGPFDGVIAFSQGSALAASILLDHALNNPHEPPPFNFAVFIAGVMPFSPDLSLYTEMLEEVLADPGTPDSSSDSDDEPTSQHNRFHALMNTAAEVRELMFAEMTAHKNGQRMMEAMNADPFSPESCRPFHPNWVDERITIPTLHIMGNEDPWLPHGKVLYDLCSPKERTIMTHTGGHDVPRDPRSMAEAAKLVVSTYERSKLAASGII